MLNVKLAVYKELSMLLEILANVLKSKTEISFTKVFTPKLKLLWQVILFVRYS